MTKERNDRLERLLLEAGLSLKALARGVREAARASGEYLGTDHTLAKKWVEDGVRPRGNTPRYVAQVLSAKLGRLVTVEDLGWPKEGTSALERAVAYPVAVDDASTNLAGVWAADLADSRAVAGLRVDPAAWSRAAFQSLIPQRLGELSRGSSSRRVGAADIAAIRSTVQHFDGLDDRFGGGVGRQALIAFLASNVAPLLSASCGDAVRRELFSAAAEATLLGAWMSYDSGRHALAQRYFIQGLRLAHEGQDKRLAGSVLSAMSHQATFLGRFVDAADLARAAVATVGPDGTGTLRAQFHAMEARALARLNDVTGCDLAVADALRHFEQRRPDNDPEFIRYFDDVELDAELGHCWRDLGRSRDAVARLEAQSVDPAAPVRSDVFVTLVRADAYVAMGELEQACTTALQALELGRDLRSERPTAYVREFRGRLTRHRQDAHVRGFLEQVTAEPLWQATRTAPAAA